MVPEPVEVQAMFGRIAPRYDLLNRVLSAGIDRRWRKRLLARVGPVTGRRVVDVACGTGDLALLFRRHGAHALGVDFTAEMLARAEDKARRARADSGARFLVVRGDALALPVAKGQADLATIAFGLRNLADRLEGVREMARVVRPGGRVVVLEFSMPSGPIAPLYRLYLTRLLPRVGGWVSGDGAAYRYLPDTVVAWPSPEELQREMEGAGLVECGFERLSSGIACLSWGRVPTS